MVLRQKGATCCNLHRMSFLSWFPWTQSGGLCEQQEVPKDGRHRTPASALGTFYVRLGDGVTEDVSAALRRITRTSSTALMTPVSNKTAQMARTHEPRSGQPSKIQSHDVAPNSLASSETPSKMASGKAMSQVSRRPRRRNWGRRGFRCSNFLDQRRKRRSGQSARVESTTRILSKMR